MREGNGLGEWSPLPLLVTLAVLATMALLVVGTGAALLTDGLGVAGADPPPPTTTGRTATVPTEIGEAAVEVRAPLVPAPTDHLTLVRISASSCGDRRSGTGVVVADGLVLTAAHVVGSAALVRLDAGGVVVTGEVLGVTADGRDLALVEVDAPMQEPVALGVSHRIGEPVTIAGYPGGGRLEVAVGARVEVGATVETVVAGELLGVDAHAPEGMSGGPAIDAAGRLLGIVVASEEVGATAIVVTIDDITALAQSPLVAGDCPTSA